MPFRDLLNILEGNKLQVPNKGNHIPWGPHVVYFTSDRHPEDWLIEDEKDKSRRLMYRQEWLQVRRRLSVVEYLRKPVHENVQGGALGDNTGNPPVPQADLAAAALALPSPSDFQNINHNIIPDLPEFNFDLD